MRSVAVGLCLGNTHTQDVQMYRSRLGVARSCHSGYAYSERMSLRGDEEYGERQSDRNVE